MKKAVIFLTIFSGILVWGNSFSQVTFQKFFGNVLFNYGTAVLESTTGGYLLGGSISDSSGNYNILLIRTDPFGDTLWTKNYGNQTNEEANRMIETSNGDFVITGDYNSDLLLMKVNAQGTMLWSHSFGFYANEGGKSVIETSDSGYAFVAARPDTGHWKTILIKTDHSGNPQLSRYYSSSFTSFGKGVIQVSDGGYVITGDINEQSGATVTDYFVIRTDEDGDTLWTKSFGVTGLNDNVHAIINVPGGYLVAGFTAGGPTGSDLFLHKMDESGNLVWARTYLGTVFTTLPILNFMSVAPAIDGGYFFTGKKNVGNNFAIFKTDSSGNLQWSRGALDIYGQAVCGVSTQDGGYIVTGSTMNSLNGLDLVLFKTDSLGWSGCNEQNVSTPSASLIPQPKTYPFISSVATDTLISSVLNVSYGTSVFTECFFTGISEPVKDNPYVIFPNPFNTEINVAGLMPGAEIEVIDISGRKVFQKTAVSESIIIETDLWSRGCYFVKITAETGVVIKKLVK